MDQSSQIVQFVLSGLSNGAIYALIGFGFAIIYNATGIINFAQGGCKPFLPMLLLRATT